MYYIYTRIRYIAGSKSMEYLERNAQRRTRRGETMKKRKARFLVGTRRMVDRAKAVSNTIRGRCLFYVSHACVLFIVIVVVVFIPINRSSLSFSFSFSFPPSLFVSRIYTREILFHYSSFSQEIVPRVYAFS